MVCGCLCGVCVWFVYTGKKRNEKREKERKERRMLYPTPPRKKDNESKKLRCSNGIGIGFRDYVFGVRVLRLGPSVPVSLGYPQDGLGGAEMDTLVLPGFALCEMKGRSLDGRFLRVL